MELHSLFQSLTSRMITKKQRGSIQWRKAHILFSIVAVLKSSMRAFVCSHSSQLWMKTFSADQTLWDHHKWHCTEFICWDRACYRYGYRHVLESKGKKRNLSGAHLCKQPHRGRTWQQKYLSNFCNLCWESGAATCSISGTSALSGGASRNTRTPLRMKSHQGNANKQFSDNATPLPSQPT